MNKKKSQGLPLNTIILFIIVIVVLVMIIVWFTNKFSETGSNIESSSEGLSKCTPDNPIIKNAGYTIVVACKKTNNGGVEGCVYNDNNFKSCNANEGYERIIGIKLSSDEAACCGKKS